MTKPIDLVKKLVESKFCFYTADYFKEYICGHPDLRGFRYRGFYERVTDTACEKADWEACPLNKERK